MVSRKATAALAAAALSTLVTCTSIRAQTTQPASADQPKLLQEAPAAVAAEPDRRPIMQALNYAGIAQPLEKARINIFGHAEAGYTQNFDSPESGLNFGRVFDFKSNQLMFNQLDLTVERTLDPTKWDVGGRMEWIYGEDAGTIHSNGLFDWYELQRAKGDSHNSPTDQWDLNQLYADFGVPLSEGLRIRVGKYVTPMGYETINPTTNPFYSHSYLFGFAIPFTQTGVIATYQYNDNWTFEGGVFRGWEQSWEDNNDAVSFDGRVAFTSTDKKLSLIGQFVTGPEEPDDSRDYRTVFDMVASYAFTDKFTLAANSDFGWEGAAAPDGGTAYWYGIAGYAGYKLNDYVTLNARAEWFRDEEGVRIGIAGNYYELTLGATIHPFPHDRWGKNLLVRPEIRGDWSNNDVYNDGDNSSMYTAAIDVIYLF